MVQDIGPEDVGTGDGRSRKFGAGWLRLLLLTVVIAVILWLLWLFLYQSPERNRVTEIVSTSTIDVVVPAVPVEEEVLAEEIPTSAEVPKVPDVVGDTQSSALLALEDAGYTVDLTYVFSDSKPAGVVIQQNPSAGVMLRTGAVVGLIVSRGTPDVPQVEMPDIIGLSKAAAVAKVKAAGLRPYILYGTDQNYAGRVGSQWPLGGTRIPKGSEGFIQVMIVR